MHGLNRAIEMFAPKSQTHSGGRGSFEEAVRPHLDVLYRVARRMTRNAEEAEDIVGQTLLLGYKHWNRFDGEHTRSWLIRILKNEFLGLRRKQRSRPEETELDLEVGDQNKSWTGIADRLNSERIIQAMEQLPEEFRMVSLLCDVEQMSYEEVAEALDIPLGTVRSRLFRARARLRELLADFVAEGAH